MSMSDEVVFNTIFTEYPLLNIAVMVGGLSYILLAVIWHFSKRSRYLKDVLNGKHDISNETDLNFLKTDVIAKFVKWDQKRCVYQAIISAFLFLCIICVFIYYLIESGTQKDVYMFAFTFLLLASGHGFINSIVKIIDARKMNNKLKENIRPAMYAQFNNAINTEAVYLYFSAIFNVVCIIVFAWFLYSEFI